MRIESYRPEHAPLVSALQVSQEGCDLWCWHHQDNPEARGVEAAIARGSDEAVLAVRSALRAAVVMGGRSVIGAELVEGPPDRAPVGEEVELALGGALLASLRERGVAFAYAIPGGAWSLARLTSLGFRPGLDLVFRNFYLGVSDEVSARFGADRLSPVRRLATFARSLRMKLIDVELNDEWAAYGARLFNLRRDELSFAFDRSPARLIWRYAKHPTRKYRMLVLRRRAGVGLDAYAIVRMFRDPVKGRNVMQLVDHWTKVGERRSTAWLLGELALWGWTEKVDVIQAAAPADSTLERVLIGAGMLRKKQVFPVLFKALESEVSLSNEAKIRAGDFDAF